MVILIGFTDYLAIKAAENTINGAASRVNFDVSGENWKFIERRDDVVGAILKNKFCMS